MTVIEDTIAQLQQLYGREFNAELLTRLQIEFLLQDDIAHAKTGLGQTFVVVQAVPMRGLVKLVDTLDYFRPQVVTPEEYAAARMPAYSIACRGHVTDHGQSRYTLDLRDASTIQVQFKVYRDIGI